MALLGNLVINVLADTKKFKNDMKGVETTTKGTMQRIGKLTSFVKAYWAEMLVAYAAVKKFVDIAKDFSKEAFESEQSIALLNSTLQATGIYTDELSQQLQNYSSEMQKITMFTDEQITSAQGILATFTQIGTDAYPEVIERAMDMSTIFGQDLQQSIVQLGKAINDPRLAEGLRRIGITMSEQQVDMIDYFLEMGDLWSAQRVILDELELELGGAARAMGETTAGQAVILKNSFGELKEEIGYLINENMPAFIEMAEGMVEALMKIVKWVGKAKREANEWREEIRAMTEDQLRELIKTNDERLDQMAEEMTALQNVIDSTSILSGKHRQAKKDLEALDAEWWELVKANKEARNQLDLLAKQQDEKIKKDKEDKQSTDAKTEANEAWLNTIVLSGDALRDYIQQWDSFREGNEYLTGAINATNEAMVKSHAEILESIEFMQAAENAAWSYGNSVRAVQESIEELTWAEEQLKNMQWNVGEMVSNSTVPAFELFADTSKKVGDTLKDFIKTALSNLLKALGAKLAVMATLYALTLQFGKAALATAGAAAAYAAAGAVQNLQQGGPVEGMQRLQQGGFGDVVPALLEPGEMIIPKEVVREEQPAIQQAIGGEGEGGLTQVILDGRILSNWITKQIENKKILVSKKAIV